MLPRYIEASSNSFLFKLTEATSKSPFIISTLISSIASSERAETILAVRPLTIDIFENLEVATTTSIEFSLYEAFESAGHTVNSANARVSSRLISNKEAEILSVVLPAAVTVVFRTSFNQTERLIEASEATYLSDFYSYDVNLARGVANIVSMK